MTMTIKQFVFNALSENTYIVFDETRECIIIDPGCYEGYEKNELKRFIEENALKVKLLINTHCHIDHILGNSFIKNEYGVKLVVHKKELDNLKATKFVAPIYGFPAYEHCDPDTYIKEGEKIKFGDSTLDVLYLPGHAAGHIAFVNEKENVCIAGDVLFKDSIGRTDLPGGDHNTLIDSIKTQLFQFPDDMTVYCGHGPNTSIGYEKQYNPFCGVAAN